MQNELMNTTQDLRMEEDKSLVLDFSVEAKQMYCSIQATNDKEKKALYNIMNTPKHRVADAINKTINLVGVYAEIVMMKNEETGVRTPAPRIVLIDDKMEGYACVSTGIYSALTKIMSIEGDAKTWAKPIPIEITQITKGAGNGVRNILTIKLV